jgi:hypothetical protein
MFCPYSFGKTVTARVTYRRCLTPQILLPIRRVPAGWRQSWGNVSLPEVHGSVPVLFTAGLWQKTMAFAGPGDPATELVRQFPMPDPFSLVGVTFSANS